MDIQLIKSSGLPFVCYREPGERNARFLAQSDFSAHPFSETETSRGFLFLPFRDSLQNPSLLLKPDFVRVFDEPARFAEAFSSPFPFKLGASDQPEVDRKTFEDSVSAVIEEIRAGTVSKTIVSRIKAIEKPDDFSPFALFAKLCEKSPAQYVYLFYHPAAGLWIGATPEKILSWRGNRAETVALAATKLRDPAAQREWSEKERAEFNVVTEYVENSLRTCGVRDARVIGPFDQPSGNLLHLKSVYSFSLPEGFSTTRFLNDFHPTPAIAGSPKKESLQLIDALERHRREYFCGCLGWVDGEKNGSLFVNLRCMKILRTRCELHAGCGITPDSDPAEEWRECVEKIRGLLNLTRGRNNPPPFRNA